MMETEWLVCTDPNPMLEHVGTTASDRKLRLFGVACCRRVWRLLHDKRSQKAVEWSERFADGQIGKERLSAARQKAEDAWRQRVFVEPGGPPDKAGKYQYAAEAAKFVAGTTHLIKKMQSAARASLRAELLEQEASSSQPKSQQCHLVREIFGNPFRPSSPLSAAVLAWSGGTVAKLVQSIYEKRAYDRLLILADALEEAGCTEAAILNHCRQPGEHARGCWVLDLLLKKT